jgi:hypothetical protein
MTQLHVPGTVEDREGELPRGSINVGSVLLLILALAAGMAIVRSRLQLDGMTHLWANGTWANGHRAKWIAEVVESELAGIVLVLGVAMAVEGWRNPIPPTDRRWGIGRMTIALSATWIALSWLARLVSGEFNNLHHYDPVTNITVFYYRPAGSYALYVVNRLYYVGDGMIHYGFPVWLGATWIVWRIGGRRARTRGDLTENVGRIIGTTIFATYIIFIVVL